MSKNFLNFLTTSVIILSCGTVINSSSCYCMESKILSPQNQELSKKLSNELLNELCKIDTDLKNKRDQRKLTIDVNNHKKIIEHIIENQNFLKQQDLLRDFYTVYINALITFFVDIRIPSETIENFLACMTSCIKLGSQISNSLYQLWHSYIKANYDKTSYHSENDTFLQDILVSNPREALKNIMANTGEIVNSNNINTPTIKLQHLLNYLNNKIYLIIIDHIQQIEELIKDNTQNIDMKEQRIKQNTRFLCYQVLRISYQLREYLASVNKDWKTKDGDVAHPIAEEIANYISENLEYNIQKVLDALQTIPNDCNDTIMQKLEPIKKYHALKRIEDDKTLDKYNTSLIERNEYFLNESQKTNNGDQIDTSKNIKQVKDSKIRTENSNSILDKDFVKSRKQINKSGPIINSKDLIQSEKSKIIETYDNSPINNTVLKPSNDINNRAQIENSTLTSEASSEEGEDINSSEPIGNSNSIKQAKDSK